MADNIPRGITRDHLLAAIRQLDQGAAHKFGESTGYDVLFNSKRYPPKAVVGLAAEHLLGKKFGPYDFKGGLNTRCFAVLSTSGFVIVTKQGVPIETQ